MKNRNVAVSITACLLLILFTLFISGCATKLVEIDKSIPKLKLSEEQSKIVKPKMDAIREIYEKYNIEKEEFENDLKEMRENKENRGERDSLREKIQEFQNKRKISQSAIDVHIKDIKSVLKGDQLATFEKMKFPELEMPDIPMGPGGKGAGGRPPDGMGGGRGGGPRGGGMM